MNQRLREGKGGAKAGGRGKRGEQRQREKGSLRLHRGRAWGRGVRGPGTSKGSGRGN